MQPGVSRISIRTSSSVRDVRGTIAPGMLADFAVCSVNIVKEVDRILDMEIDMTIVDGRIVFDRATDEVRKAR